MSDSNASIAISEQIGAAIEHAITDGRQIANAASYNKATDAVVILCLPFAIIIDRSWMPEFQNIPPDVLETLYLSPSGSTLIVETENLYIETAGLVARFIGSIRTKNMSGSLLIDLLQGSPTS